MTDPLATSADTWRDAKVRGASYLERLRPVGHGSPRERWQHFRSRFEARRSYAEEYYASLQRPQRSLPVASSAQVRKFVFQMLRDKRWFIVLLLTVNVVAALLGLTIPRVLGSIIDRAAAGDVTLAAQLIGVCLVVIALAVGHSLFVYFANLISAVLGQRVLAEARERIVDSLLQLPLSRVEQASTGDLVTRVTRDVTLLAETLRFALPRMLVATVMVVAALVASLINSWLLGLASIVGVGYMIYSIRWYVRHAPAGYLTEGAATSQINNTLTETVEGARTVEALQLGDVRIEKGDVDLAFAGQAERYKATLHNYLFGNAAIVFNAPLALVVLLGGWGYMNGLVSLGQITVAVLYLQMLIGPEDELMMLLNRVQSAEAAARRLLGIEAVESDREATDAEPDGVLLEGHDLRFAYREGHDVLHGIDLELKPGERVAVVGPSGSGKSTLSRLLAGINRPRTGVVTVGDVDVMDLPLSRLRTEVALVTQEHHVFVGSIRDNIVLAREDAADDAVWQALVAVGARSWVKKLPDQLDTQVGSGNHALTPAQAQQIALARLVIADPHTLVLDEATSLIDPATARHLEGAITALLSGRTVVAIAHRLHTAHDADRIVVIIDGKIAESGSHDELLAAGGEYAHLWRVWTS